MKHFWVRSQLVFISIILLLTIGMMMAIVMRFNSRWDVTKEKLYSLSDSTIKILNELNEDSVEVIAFYPNDDPVRKNFETYLKECQLHHPKFNYFFYDPDRVPTLAKKYNVKNLYAVIVRYSDRQERMVGPDSEKFANALLRLANPKRFEVCFVTGHGEASLGQEDRTGYKSFKQTLLDSNYFVHEIILSRDRVPERCNAVVVAGPHRDFDGEEFDLLGKTFREGKGIFFLIDPMDTGAGGSFRKFLDRFGVVLGDDVIVDKMSRMVGGDFLVPLVSQYVTEHPITHEFEHPTFFPVSRSIQPSTREIGGLEVVPLALSGSGSWAETNLSALEKGEAAFESETDLAGPICVAVAVENTKEEDPEKRGRMVAIGDSDFLSNAYIDLSGNRDLAANAIQWLVKDDRFISIRTRQPEFQPLLLSAKQRTLLLVIAIAVIPASFLLIGSIWMIWRKRTS